MITVRNSWRDGIYRQLCAKQFCKSQKTQSQCVQLKIPNPCTDASPKSQRRQADTQLPMSGEHIECRQRRPLKITAVKMSSQDIRRYMLLIHVDLLSKM